MIYYWPSLDDATRRLVWRSCVWRHRGITKCCHRVALALRVRRECFMSHMTAFMWAIQFLTLELTERIALFSRQPQFSCNSLVVVVVVSADRSELKSKFCINSQRRRHSQDLRAVMSARQHSKRTVIVHDWADNRLTLWRHWRDAWWRHTLALCLLANCKLLCRASVSRLRRRVGSILGRTTTARDCCADYLAERKIKQVSRKISVSIATTHPQADCFISGVLPHSAQVLLLRQVLLLEQVLHFEQNSVVVSLEVRLGFILWLKNICGVGLIWKIDRLLWLWHVTGKRMDKAYNFQRPNENDVKRRSTTDAVSGTILPTIECT